MNAVERPMAPLTQAGLALLEAPRRQQPSMYAILSWRGIIETFIRFGRRQVADIRQGGWLVAWRKGLMLLEVLLAIPVVLAARLLRRVVRIRFGGLPTTSIGHLAIEMELLLCRRDAGHYGRTIDLFCCALPVCNQPLKRMWERAVHVSRFGLAAERINRWLPGGQGNRIPFEWAPSDVHGLLTQQPPHLSFTPAEQRQGWDALRKLGIPEGARFICVMARDPAYYATRPRYRDVVTGFRNSDIRAYFPAMQRLVERGYLMVRMGAAVSQPLPDRPGFVDYAATGRTEFLDIFLCAHCHFYLGDSAGLHNVPIIFRRPVAMANTAPFEYSTSWSPRDLFIPKMLWLRVQDRAMTYREILESGAGRYTRPHQYEQLGVETIENTPEEIMALALEMEARCAGTWQTSAEDEALQQRFWDVFRTYTTYYTAGFRTHRLIGAEFLRQHQDLLEAQEALARVSC